MDAGTILTSTLVAAVVSGLISLYLKQREYKNDYYSMIIKRRIAAYEQLEQLIIAIKTVVIDPDNRPYHRLFAKDDDWSGAFSLIMNASSKALWLSTEAFKKVQELSDLVFLLGLLDGGVIEFGKENYQKIGELRIDLERILAKDLLNLHNVKHFLKQKTIVESGFRELRR